jgi:hypothetical protein
MGIMRVIGLGTVFVAVCLVAGACSSTTNGNGGQGGQTGSGGSGSGGQQTGAGGNSAGGAGGTGNSGAGGHASDAGQDAAGPDATGAGDCHPACGTGFVCVGTGVQGGAVFFADGGVCPAGRHAQGNICIQDLTWACKPIPSGCNGVATCACASSLCTQGGCSSPTLDELTCILAVP